jgi:hypothetical protein
MAVYISTVSPYAVTDVSLTEIASTQQVSATMERTFGHVHDGDDIGANNGSMQ